MSRRTPDRISQLPDSVLVHILSLIPTKQVVQTSILSRRWRYVWTSMTILEFDDKHFPFVRVSPTDTNTRFVNFVDMVMQSHDNSDIQKFRLACSDSDVSHVYSWIDIAVKHNVQELDIEICRNNSQFLGCLFTCKSLVFLKFNFYMSRLDLPDSMCLTRLRTLHITLVSFKEQDSLTKLLSSCPVPENLVMIGCGWEWGYEVMEISSPTVRNFTMDGTWLGQTAEGNMRERFVKISMPNLISLKFTGFIAGDYVLENLPSLVDAYIHIKFGKKYWDEENHELYEDCGARLANLLRVVSNAKSLILSITTLELLANAPDLFELLPTFHNLKKLMLKSGRSEAHLAVVACLLRRCPVLESLEIDMRQFTIKEFDSEDGLDFEGLVLDQLKEVKISSFGRTREELEFVNLLLGSPSKTKRQIILEEEEEEENLERRTEISIV